MSGVSQMESDFPDFEKKKQQKETSASHIFVQLLFSHFGIFVIVAVYAVVGAYAFVEIEKPHEDRLFEIKQQKAVEVNQTINYMANLFWFQQDKNWTFPEFNASVYKDLKKLEAFIISAVQNYRYDGTTMGWDPNWTFPKSLLLTMTIMSTIGYGHIYPVTKTGQLFCIVYAIIGTPLLLVFLGNLGNSMASSFIYVYSRCCCRWCRSVRNDSELPPKVSKKSRKLLIDDVVGTESYMPTDHLYVPITLTLMLLFSYIVLGGVVFACFENWDLASASYFSFVTLSTIGFGDLTPSSAMLEGPDHSGLARVKMIVAIGYIVFGMALLSMCLNLMQEQILEKCRWLAKEIGLSKTDNVEEMKDKDKDKNKDKDKDKDFDNVEKGRGRKGSVSSISSGSSTDSGRSSGSGSSGGSSRSNGSGSSGDSGLPGGTGGGGDPKASAGNRRLRSARAPSSNRSAGGLPGSAGGAPASAGGMPGTGGKPDMPTELPAILEDF